MLSDDKQISKELIFQDFSASEAWGSGLLIQALCPAKLSLPDSAQVFDCPAKGNVSGETEEELSSWCLPGSFQSYRKCT